MSKIAEKKAEERFPLRKIDNGGTEAYYNAGQLNRRRVYIEAYDQAMQDFLEKACEWLKENGGSYWMDDYDLPTDDLVNDFKNYMQNEM